MTSPTGLLFAYKHILPLPADAPQLSLGEGDTPLLPLQNTPLPSGIAVFVKTEGANPTGSFKDRGMVAAVAEAVARGAECIICASTGNTSASAAAYAAHAGLPCIVLIPEGKVAKGKIAQAVAHGAKILQVRGDFDDAMAAVRLYQESGKVAVVNSINPMRLQGQKTAAWEIIKRLGNAPDYHALPVGNAGNITAHWIGYCEAANRSTKACSFCAEKKCPFLQRTPCADSPGIPDDVPCSTRPVMLGYQAEGSAPFVHGMPVENPETVATAIRIGNPQSFEAAKMALSESGGQISTVSDQQILAAQKHLAAREGIFCEPASAASVAGVLADIEAGKLTSPATIVCTLTGHGLKDPDIVGAPSVTKTDSDINKIQGAIDNMIADDA